MFNLKKNIKFKTYDKSKWKGEESTRLNLI